MQVKEHTAEEVQEVLSDKFELILYNDNVNTFEHVVDCLVSICDHSEQQAEQCAYITHHKGQCTVKNGSYENLKPICVALQLEQLSVGIK